MALTMPKVIGERFSCILFVNTISYCGDPNLIRFQAMEMGGEPTTNMLDKIYCKKHQTVISRANLAPHLASGHPREFDGAALLERFAHAMPANFGEWPEWRDLLGGRSAYCRQVFNDVDDEAFSE